MERSRLSFQVPITFVVAIACLAALLASCRGPGENAPADAERENLRFWITGAMVDHGFSREEAAAALERSPAEIAALVGDLDIDLAASAFTARNVLRVLPYPGGRHPRIGFLDGAIDPHRDTKASVFLPWPDAGYVVVDLPEALWWRHGDENELLYLAHTHIPTRWDRENVVLERIDWRRGPGGVLSSHRRLPNGVEFHATVTPRADRVEMELALRNGSAAPIAGLRTQVCVMLKGAPEFAAQSDDNKRISGRAVAALSRDGRRVVATVWDRARPWQNPPVPCIHSDPVFPDLAVGETGIVRGVVLFHESDGSDELSAWLEALGASTAGAGTVGG